MARIYLVARIPPCMHGDFANTKSMCNGTGRYLIRKSSMILESPENSKVFVKYIKYKYHNNELHVKKLNYQTNGHIRY